MTQKEYKEKIEELEKLLKSNNERLQEELDKNYKYEEILLNYYIVNEDLRKEKEWNRQNVDKIEEQRRIIERYEKILDKFTFSYGG